MYRQIVRRLVANLGWNISELTDLNILRRFIKECRPVKVPFSLIRLGSNSDGGYLVPNDLNGVTACFSPGVGDSVTFEKAIAELGIPVFMLDATVDEPPQMHTNFFFEKKFLMAHDGDNSYSLDSWVHARRIDKGDFILQMDIEGNEYEVLNQVSIETLLRFRIIVIEFHNLHGLLSDYGFRYISTILRKLLKHYHLVHLHPNNCCGVFKVKDLEIPRVMEFTFIRRDRCESQGQQDEFPNKLDFSNIESKPQLDLPGCWYR